MSVDEYIKSLVFEGVSDIHFKVGCPPLCRVHGVLTDTQAERLGPEDTMNIATAILKRDAREALKEKCEYDASYSIPGFSRFRANIFLQRGTVSIIMRIIPYEVQSLDELGVPEVIKNLSLTERGLILITGAAGTGKSSTLAGMIHHINHHRKCHIITLEDPIEFLHRDKQASINQREIGIDTGSFSTALRAALRQDPDVILVGEMRDAETMEIALRAAETGHFVLSTLHTTDTKETVSRIVDAFPPHQQNQLRSQLAANLKAVISQRLLEKKDKSGRVLAAEIMVVNAAIRGHILQPYQSEQIFENMVKGKDQYGMQTFDQAIYDLLSDGVIDIEEAMRCATSPNDLKLKLSLR